MQLVLRRDRHHLGLIGARLHELSLRIGVLREVFRGLTASHCGGCALLRMPNPLFGSPFAGFGGVGGVRCRARARFRSQLIGQHEAIEGIRRQGEGR